MKPGGVWLPVGRTGYAIESIGRSAAILHGPGGAEGAMWRDPVRGWALAAGMDERMVEVARDLTRPRKKPGPVGDREKRLRRAERAIRALLRPPWLLDPSWITQADVIDMQGAKPTSERQLRADVAAWQDARGGRGPYASAWRNYVLMVAMRERASR